MKCDDLEVRQNDLLPPLTIDVTDQGEPVDMTTATSVNVLGYQGGVELFNRSATTVGIGQVMMNWETGDTDTIGPMKVFVRINWTGRELTVEPDNKVMILRVP